MMIQTLAFIGPSEIIIVLIVALLVFGPDKLPQIGRQIGTFKRQMDRMKDDLHRTIEGLDEYIPTDTPRYDAPYGQTYAQNEGHPLFPPTVNPDVPLLSEPPGPPVARAAIAPALPTVAEMDALTQTSGAETNGVAQSTLNLQANGVHSPQEITGVAPVAPILGAAQATQSTSKEQSV